MLLPSKMTLLKRMLFWLLAITTVSFITLIIMGLEVRDTIRQNGLVRIHTILEHKIQEIHTYVHQQYTSIDNLRQLLYFASRHHSIFDKTFWKSSPVSLEKGLNGFAKKNGFYDIFVITRQGDVVYTVKHESDFHTNLFHGKYRDTELAHVFRDALNAKTAYISDFDFYEPSNNFAAFMAEPIIDNGHVIGVAAVQIDNKIIQSVINNYTELGQTGDVIAAVIRHGKMMSVSTTRFGDITAYTYFDPKHMVTIDQAAMGKMGQMYTIDRRGHNVAAAWNYQDELHMGLAVKIDQSELLQGWYKQITTLFLLFASGVTVVMWMVVVAMRSFAKPIHELTQYAVNISHGNYKIHLESEQYDREWQLLTRVFQTMAIDIDQKMTQLRDQNILLSNQKNKIEELNWRLEEKIKVKTKQLNRFVNIIDQYVITSQTDKEGNITHASEAFCRISGYSREELIGANHRIVRHPDMPNALFDDMWKTITSGKIWRGEIKNRTKEGSYYWVDSTISPNMEDGTITGYTAIRQDISNQKIIEELAVTDSMTGLYNRRYYVKTITEEMNRVKRHGYSLALMMIDVDNFKLYNDTYGHKEGDEVLIRVADVLKTYTSRSSEYAFRMGGEEFAVLVSDMMPDEYYNLGVMMCEAIEKMGLPHEKNDASPYVTVSIGIALFIQYLEMDCEQLYKAADDQLYLAKSKGRNQVAINPFS